MDQPFYFANSTNCFTTRTRQMYATLYNNQVWDDWLVAIANMDPKPQQTTLDFHSPQTLGIAPDKEYLAFDIHRRTTKPLKGPASPGFQRGNRSRGKPESLLLRPPATARSMSGANGSPRSGMPQSAG
jgi:hypothetical protein